MQVGVGVLFNRTLVLELVQLEHLSRLMQLLTKEIAAELWCAALTLALITAFRLNSILLWPTERASERVTSGGIGETGVLAKMEDRRRRDTSTCQTSDPAGTQRKGVQNGPVQR